MSPSGTMRLSGKVALVTGSGSGIGRAIALRFARDGAEVALNYPATGQGAAGVRRDIEALGRKAVAIKADVGRVPEAQALVQEAFNHFGRLDVVVNNAGIERRAPFWSATEADYDDVLAVNLKGPFFVSQAAVTRWLRDRRGGKIINISSIHETLPFPCFASYGASKGGLRMLTRTLAVELGPFGITVNGIAPGAIATPMNAALLNDPRQLGALLHQIPLGRLGQPDDVAGVASFLASPDGDYVTGATYFVDGGLTWHYEEQPCA